MFKNQNLIMQEFTNSIGMKIFYSAIAVFMIGFSIFLFNMPLGESVSQWVIIIPILIMLFAILILISQVRRKIIISADSVIRINAFGERELLTANIRGCRIGAKTIYIEPASASGNKIVINNYDDLANSEDLVKWLKDNFADLNNIDLKKNQQEFSQDTSVGTTEEQRKEVIKKAKVVAVLYCITGMAIGFSVIFIENNYIDLGLTIGCPLLGVLIMAFSKGLIKFVSNAKTSIYPSIFLGFPIPAFIMLVKSLDQFDLLSTDKLWLPAIVISLAMTALFYFTGINRSLASIKGPVIFMFLTSLLFGFGAARQLNCVLDSSTPVVFNVAVVDHRVIRSKGVSYYLTLSPWGPRHDAEEVTVRQTVYDDTPIGGAVSVNVKKGFLNIPWYTVSER